MNTEIKFRVWGNFDGKMQMMECGPMEVNDNGLWFGFPIPAHYDGMPEQAIVVQFTGLTDKNGKEIYEGDILRIHWQVGDYTEETVSYDGGHGYWKYGNNPICELTEGEYCGFEVVDNIYENPELLK